MQLILYKAPGSIWDKGIRVVSGSMYSHAELVIAGELYSSMYGVGVRKKASAIKPEEWHSFECIQSAREALIVFEGEQGSATIPLVLFATLVDCFGSTLTSTLVGKFVQRCSAWQNLGKLLQKC